jgi:hypothetical protein
MAIILVDYDLKQPGQAYDSLMAYVKQHPWARLSESSYAIDTSSTPEDVKATIRRITDSNDNIYVITLKRPYSSWGPKDVNEWLDQRLT